MKGRGRDVLFLILVVGGVDSKSVRRVTGTYAGAVGNQNSNYCNRLWTDTHDTANASVCFAATIVVHMHQSG